MLYVVFHIITSVLFIVL